jgi:hypothetical protein
LTVFVGKYDGVDLPAKACEILVIDGLPELYGLLERIEQEALDGTHRQLVRQVQRIEQGMGRGVRSSQDHCVVLLMGAKLTQRLHRPDARTLFSSATRAQLDLGREVTAQLKGKPLSEIASVMDLCLTGDDEWLDASRSATRLVAKRCFGGDLSMSRCWKSSQYLVTLSQSLSDCPVSRRRNPKIN